MTATSPPLVSHGIPSETAPMYPAKRLCQAVCHKALTGKRQVGCLPADAVSLAVLIARHHPPTTPWQRYQQEDQASKDEEWANRRRGTSQDKEGKEGNQHRPRVRTSDRLMHLFGLSRPMRKRMLIEKGMLIREIFDKRYQVRIVNGGVYTFQTI